MEGSTRRPGRDSTPALATECAARADIMPDPGLRFRKLTVTLAIAIIASRSNGFSIDRVTLDDTDLRVATDIDQAPQESFKASSVTNVNDITRGKDDGKIKNKYKFTSEIGLQYSTEETTLDTIQNTDSTLDLPVTGLPSNNQDVANKSNEDLKVTGLKKGSKFNKSIATANTVTTLSGSTVGLISQTLVNNNDVLDIITNDSGIYQVKQLTSNLSHHENEYLTTMSDVMSKINYNITPSTIAIKINDQMAIDSESAEKLTVKNQNTTENTTGIMNAKKESNINSIPTSEIPMSDDKNENLSKLTELTEISVNTADSNSMTSSTTPFGNVKYELSNITTEASDTTSSRANSISIDKISTTSLDGNKNENDYMKTDSIVITPSKADSDSIKTLTTPLDNNNNEKLNTKTESSYIVPATTVDSNSLQSLISPLSSKEIEQANITKSTDAIPFKAKSNSVQMLTTPDYKINEPPYLSTESTEFQRSRANLTTLESKLESNLTNEKEKSTSARVEVSTSTNDQSEISKNPSWKKYTSIVRKRVTSSEEISPSSNNDLAKAESRHTTLPISMTSTNEDSVSNVNLLSTATETNIESVTTEFKPGFEPTQSVSENLSTVSSKRAGFLDLSKMTTAQSEDTSTVQETDFNTLYEMEAADIETQENKKVIKGHESRQLAEDAIQEELMKEELINNHNENLKVYEASAEKKQHTDHQRLLDLTTSQSMIDDKLSVQPINQDRRTTLYTVGANYKPMKRIEVQPAKSVVRDPDDNSWRNESISSLGIVFKPSNSSIKSYKEVLKTKTETVFNNLQDKEYKDNTPELRERLEKIAEVRKKKKKFDKFGEVYTDYEEGGSAERTATSTPSSEIISSGISPSEMTSTLPSHPQAEITSPMTTTTDDSYWNKKLGMISKEDIFKDLGLDVLTTQKAKKPYNLAEYYESTDEYDADYVTLPNIDIKKKFTQPAPRMTTFPLSTAPLVLPTTRIAAPRFPERKPTVQYFPPTTKPQHVNVNDYDVDFEKRVELYTLKDMPKTSRPIGSERVATDRPRADFTMFTPHSPEARGRPGDVAGVGESEPRNIVVDDGSYSRGTYVIKHFRDFLSDAAQDDPPPDFEPPTESPRGIPEAELRGTGEGKFDYDYGSQLRKDIMSRFVNNFNQNSDKFKVDFPVLFNSSVVHRSGDDEGSVVAQSSTFMKRLYGSGAGAGAGAGCVVSCDTVELSPEYELHYFVPDQEEMEPPRRSGRYETNGNRNR